MSIPAEPLTPETLERLQYPIGKFVRGTRAGTPERRMECVAVIEAFPLMLRGEAQGLSDAQLDTPYRPGGWTVRQVVHHLADSHMNALIRFKWALSEDHPTIKAYKQDLWSVHVDARTMPVAASLEILSGVHARWAVLLKNMSTADFQRTFVHPEQERTIPLAETLENYVWHSRHHLAHITGLKTRMGWE
jgi:hypothetical protein